MGVIGAGSLGFHHVRILRDMETAELAGFVESDEQRAAHVSAELGVHRYADASSLLRDVDAVTIDCRHYSVRRLICVQLEFDHLCARLPRCSTVLKLLGQ